MIESILRFLRVSLEIPQIKFLKSHIFFPRILFFGITIYEISNENISTCLKISKLADQKDKRQKDKNSKKTKHKKDKKTKHKILLQRKKFFIFPMVNLFVTDQF